MRFFGLARAHLSFVEAALNLRDLANVNLRQLDKIYVLTT